MILRKKAMALSFGAALVAGLAACGGSGDGLSSEERPNFNIPPNNGINPATSQASRQTSLWVDYQAFRAEWNPEGDVGFGDAIAYGNFGGDSRTDVFIAPGTSLYDSIPLEFYRNLGNNTFDLVTEDWITGDIPELPHPRKAIVADFNGDGQPDIAIADHGPELEPDVDFPGGHVWLLLSRNDGTYDASQLTTRVGFYHGIAAGDLTGNGLPDLFVTDSPAPGRTHQLEVFINQGGGNFVRAPERLAPNVRSLNGIYTTEIYDLDEDGYADIIIAGHEQDDAVTRVLWGGSDGYFSLSRSTTLPAVSSWGTVVDVAIADLELDGLNDLVLTRTGGGGDDNFYQGYYIQVIEQTQARTFVDVTGTAFTGGSNSDPNADWVSWTRLQDISGNGLPDILVDDRRFCLRWDSDGMVRFNLIPDACSVPFILTP